MRWHFLWPILKIGDLVSLKENGYYRKDTLYTIIEIEDIPFDDYIRLRGIKNSNATNLRVHVSDVIKAAEPNDIFKDLL